MKTVRVAALWLAAGLLGGFALSAMFSDDSQLTRENLPADDTSLIPRIARLEAQLEDLAAQTAALTDELAMLDITPTGADASGTPERRVRSFSDDAIGSVDAGGETVTVDFRERIAELRGMGGRNATVTDRLTRAGFSETEAQRIETRMEELRVAEMQSRYEAMRSGDPDGASFNPFEGDETLRAELGDTDYERYLEAMGRSTRVDVTTVLASSAAESAGIQPGDEILSYSGERVFDTRDLNRLVLEGEPGEPVVLDIQRDGQPIQLVIPRGPLGISSGRSRAISIR